MNAEKNTVRFGNFTLTGRRLLMRGNDQFHFRRDVRYAVALSNVRDAWFEKSDLLERIWRGEFCRGVNLTVQYLP